MAKPKAHRATTATRRDVVSDERAEDEALERLRQLAAYARSGADRRAPKDSVPLKKYQLGLALNYLEREIKKRPKRKGAPTKALLAAMLAATLLQRELGLDSNQPEDEAMRALARRYVAMVVRARRYGKQSGVARREQARDAHKEILAAASAERQMHPFSRDYSTRRLAEFISDKLHKPFSTIRDVLRKNGVR